MTGKCRDRLIHTHDAEQASLALVAYEYLITLDQEVATVWRRKWTATSVLIVSVRWVMVLLQISHWLSVLPNVRSSVLYEFDLI